MMDKQLIKELVESIDNLVDIMIDEDLDATHSYYVDKAMSIAERAREDSE